MGWESLVKRKREYRVCASIQRGIHLLPCQSPRFAASLRPGRFFLFSFLIREIHREDREPFVKSRRERDKTLFAPDTRVPVGSRGRSFHENSPRLIIIRRRIPAKGNNFETLNPVCLRCGNLFINGNDRFTRAGAINPRFAWITDARNPGSDVL